MKKTILLTGCAGFIGSNFVKTICCDEEVKKHYDFVIADALTYAGHYPNIKEEVESNPHLSFEKVDLRERAQVSKLFSDYSFRGLIHFAAETHVDRSILNPNIFAETNVIGTLNLLNESLKVFKENAQFRYMQVSTDEVYGELSLSDPAFSEETPLQPNSPYSASKASADMLVQSFFHTYGLPTVISRCSNNYGPYQFPEKLIPLMIQNALQDKPLPVYGKGDNVRDWIYVDDHNRGVWMIYTKGRAGEVYNLGGNSERKNIDVVKSLLKILGKSEDLISFVTDRLGHDFRYAINFSKTKKELGWEPLHPFEDNLEKTVRWYLDHQDWVGEVSSKASKT